MASVEEVTHEEAHDALVCVNSYPESTARLASARIVQRYIAQQRVKDAASAARSELAAALASAINRVSAENGSNTPDFILGELLVDVLLAFDKAVRRREEWYGRDPNRGPGSSGAAGTGVVAGP